MTTSTSTVGQGPLRGLRVVDLSTTLPGVQCSQFFADAGADVIMVEPPGGSAVRSFPGWPGLLRSRRSITLDIYDEADWRVLRGLLAEADVLITTMRPAVAERLGLTGEKVGADYPRLIVASITGFGSTGPWRNYKGYEGLVAAKTGLMHNKRQLTSRPGPAYVSVPYASWGAAHSAIHGTLAALHERVRSGLGQVVESNMVLGLGAMDPYNWFYEMVLQRYPGAYSPQDLPYDEHGRPCAPLLYSLLIAPSSDGTWLQFAQTAPRLMQAWLSELGMIGWLADPKWKGFPLLEDPELREEFWLEMISRVRARTLADWQHTFETNPDVSAEIFRTPHSAFEHPQVVHEGRGLIIEHPQLGAVRQPSPQVHVEGRPLTDPRPAPMPGDHNEELRELSLAAASHEQHPGTATEAAQAGLPLQGITIVEFGVMFAGPYGATLLTDLGARVIKIEAAGGDNIRALVPFPEAGGAKVLQGKESVVVDLRSKEGQSIVHRIVEHADVVLQCFRAGAAQRAAVDEQTLTAINPDLVYINAVGYGTSGPYGGRPAYAPSIGAATGLASTDGRGRTAAPTTDAEIRVGARTLHSANAVPAAQADGIAALGVASTIMLGLYARDLGRSLRGTTTTMLGSALNALMHLNNGYAGAPEMAVADEEFWGLNALYRIYPAEDGYVFLAAPKESEWTALATALEPYVDLGGDTRFMSASARQEHDRELAEVLAGVFAKRGKLDWEAELTGMDVGCVAVMERNAEAVLQGDEFHLAGFSVDAVSPIFDEHRRLAPVLRFSRSLTKADAGCTIGQHTDSVLTEIGYSAGELADLRERKIIE
ncbi:CaiB/BaiF CoA-transferase family protein [Mycobacterium sp. E796]|uniref:CaiB/BaiF CoA transferase family protein n=1 Tax=Mycobacterium sp. E796 TaxID=1834151 RepID=UPI0007FD7C33|nr:CoA transferase [Mycobacterium sp. E796]OBI50122.1 CoA-transferase [Mycobacterium sp. E796]